MNFGLKKNQINFNTLKAKKIKTIQQTSLNTLERDSMRNIVSSFRKGIILNKINKSKYKTSKNSPEKVYIEKPKPIQNKVNPSNVNNNFNKVKINSNIISNQNDKNMENILKKKMIKLKEKKAITSNNTLNNNTFSLSNKNIYNNNKINFNNSGSIKNYIPKSNYIKKKSKMTIETSTKNSIYSNFQKRSNSSIDDDEKNSIYSNSEKNSYLYTKNINLSSSSSKQYVNVKNNFNTIQNKSNNLILQSHLKNSSVFTSNFHTLYKPKYLSKSPKFKFINAMNKFSYPSQGNSRKNSIEKDIMMNNNISHSNIHIKINNKIVNNYFNFNNKNKNNNNNNNNNKNNNFSKSEKKNDIFFDKKFKSNQKSYVSPNGVNFNNFIKTKLNSQNNSKENIFNKFMFPESKKLTLLETLLNSHKIIKKKEKICHTENTSLRKNSSSNYKIQKTKVLNSNEMKIDKSDREINNKSNDNKQNEKNINSTRIKKTKEKINYNLIKQKEKEIKEKKEKEKEKNEQKTEKTIEKKPIETQEKKLDKLEKQSSKENEKEKESGKKQKKQKNKIPDHDLETPENLKDTLLNYINSNLDQINTQNLNESNDSIQSYTNQKYIQYSKDKEIISSYIKNFFSKNGYYPKTKMKFYKYGRLLGKGAFGKVNLCLHILTGRLVAIKSINKTKIISERQKKKIQIETSIMKTLSSSNYIVKMFETYETEKHICIVMEYISAGDLLSYIKKRSKLNENIAKYIFKQIILAIQYIHNNNIVHRDIKLDNILIDLDNKIKICDFGVSKKIINNNDLMFEQCGTPTYIAPEILKNKGYEGFGVDIWSSGVVLYAMLSGTVPFKGNDLNELHDYILKGKYNEIYDISKNASHLLKNILEIDPKKRICINDILNHPWLIDVNVNDNLSYNLFTNAEKILLNKSNVDYRDINNKDDMIENFDIRNLDTEEEIENKNIITKSYILAPFNSSIIYNDNDDFNIFDNSIIDNFSNELLINNNIIKFSVKVKELNRIYELNNNGEIDNGVVISMDSNEKNFYNNISPSPYNIGSYNSKGQSKPFSPVNELDENLIYKKEKKDYKKEIVEEALNDIAKLGYLKPYVRECLNSNEKNYATTCYFLIVKYCY